MNLFCKAAIRVGLALAFIPANAAPSLQTSVTLHDWYESLVAPDTSVSCCGVADCRTADYRIAEDGFDVLIAGAWIGVPNEKILNRSDNPTGRAVVCTSKSLGIICFVPARKP
jgi:hypothetical protein